VKGQLDLDLDLDSSRQSPTGYHGDEVCTPTEYGHVGVVSWLLKEDIEAAEVVVSRRQFH